MRKKVLMLGWEFPPLINGGLGVACLGLSKALSNYVDLTIIIPKSAQNYTKDNIELIGLNNLEVNRYDKITTKRLYEQYAEVLEIEASINPYYSSFKELNNGEVL